MDETTAHEIGVEAYVFLYPLVLMDVTRRQMTNVEAGKQVGRGPMGAFTHARQYPGADFRDVVRPNFDTLYSVAWLDVRPEPVIVSAPDTGSRYYMLPMLDMWTDVFATPGTRTSGNAAQDFAVVPVGWTGQLPAGVRRIETPTPMLWIIGRIKTDGPADYDAVHQIQDALRITPLSSWGQPPAPVPVVIDPSVDMTTPPLDQVNAMSAAEFFGYAAELLKVHPPHPTDWSALARLRRIGIEAGESFDAGALDALVMEALSPGPGDAQQILRSRLPGLAKIVSGWQSNLDTMGVYGDFYVKRTIVAMVGLGANQPEDAVYPLLLADADGKPLDGGSRYVLHFAADSLPPVDGFWSVTMYDGQGFQVANQISRFAIGDRDDLRFNPDGSLDLYLQHDSPGGDKEANWLPAPEGPLGVTMRLYSPRPAVLDGSWVPPPVQRLA
ncbi:MAG: DUF1254 domain-containing protein [Streptosporangiaceae bacterium]